MGKTRNYLVSLFCLVVFVLVLFNNAWIGDDPFITLRSVHNLVTNLKPDWNLGQRVQTFTHPLWFIVLTYFYAISHNPFFTLFGASMVASILVFVLLMRYATKPLQKFFVLLLLISSKAFIDYSTSGLENPLSHLLVLTYLIIFFGEPIFKTNRLVLLGFIASLIALNRFDLYLIVFPSLVYVILSSDQKPFQTAKPLLLGHLPLLAWLLFSIIYYGFPFPNTFYAKLTTGIPRMQLVNQGFQYFRNSFFWDPLTLSTILLCLIFSFSTRRRKTISISAGIILYLGYVVWIGGDFMSGRFFSVTFFVAVTLFLTPTIAKSLIAFPRNSLVILFVFILSHGLSNPFSPILYGFFHQSLDREFDHGIADEKLFYFPRLGLTNMLAGAPAHNWANQGLAARETQESPVIFGSVGIRGYYAGPNIIILDKFALADPLRARLSVVDLNQRVGHYYRSFPEGYIEAVRASDPNLLADSNLALFYEKLFLITNGDLLDPERLSVIFEMNLGMYDYLLSEYRAAPQ